MKLYIKLKGENIVGHDWDKEGVEGFIPCKFGEPNQIFDTVKYGYKYKVENGDYVLLSKEEFENQPVKLVNKAQEKIQKLKKKEHDKVHIKEWKEVKKLLTTETELKVVDDIILNLESE